MDHPAPGIQNIVNQLLAISQEFASDEQAFLSEFEGAWTKMMNADRFRGPDGSVCPDERAERAAVELAVA